ncbi:hypothetical protein NIES4103_50630 [Nostoc sp. NIES-4103]|nr:hypothetical protein NIES4103_50630 [Nostoc sp. NIES-4103]
MTVISSPRMNPGAWNIDPTLFWLFINKFSCSVPFLITNYELRISNYLVSGQRPLPAIAA